MTKTELNELADEISRYKVKDRDYVLFELLSRTETVLRRAASHEAGVRDVAYDIIVAYFDSHGINDAKAAAFNILDRFKNAGLTIVDGLFAIDAKRLEAAARIIHAGAFDPCVGSDAQRHEATMKATQVLALFRTAIALASQPKTE